MCIYIIKKVILWPFIRYIDVETGNSEKNGTERSLYDRILKYTGVFSSVQGVAMVVSAVLAKVKSYLIGPAGFGITENVNRTTEIIKNATNLGIQTVAVPGISLSADLPDDARLSERILVTRSWALLTAMAGMIICVALAPVLGRWAFNDTDYVFDFTLMSLSVAASSVTGGEIAILRGTGQMRNVALSQLFANLVSLCISFPLYWFFRLGGIIPALVLSAVGTMTVTCLYSFRLHPYKARPFSRAVLGKGLDMMGFGLLLTLTAFLGAWAWSIIAKFLTVQGGEELTGTYSAGYMLVTYLTTLLLSVSDSEYYPRLSAVGSDMVQAHKLMNSQSLAMCMLAAPLVIIFIICAPMLVLVVLEYEKFQASIVFAQMAAIGLLFKAVYQPIAYLVLARSDSKIYLIQESLCYLLLVVSVVCGYKLAGTVGLGLSFAVWELSYLLIVLIIGRIRYGFVMSGQLVRNFLVHAVLVALTAVCVLLGSRQGFMVSIALCIISVAFSVHFFCVHTSFLPSFFSKVFGK